MQSFWSQVKQATSVTCDLRNSHLPHHEGLKEMPCTPSLRHLGLRNPY